MFSSTRWCAERVQKNDVFQAESALSTWAYKWLFRIADGMLIIIRKFYWVFSDKNGQLWKKVKISLEFHITKIKISTHQKGDKIDKITSSMFKKKINQFGEK